MRICLVVIAIMLVSIPASADPPPDFNTTLERYNAFVAVASELLDRIVKDNRLTGFVDIEWAAFSICLLVIIGVKYIFEDLSVFDLIQPLIMIAVVRIILDNYDMITSLGWDLSEGIAGGIQTAAIGDSNPFFFAGFMIDLGRGIVFNSVSLLRSVMWTVGASLLIVIIVFLLSVLGYFVTAWAMWGYVLCKIIGIFFMPFLMLPRTQFLFDGWLRLYSGFLVYGVIARANLMLVALSIKTFFGWDGYNVDTGFTMNWDITNFADVMGITCYVVVGLFSLFCTGRFAATVVAGTIGVGGAINNAAGVVARMASNGRRGV